MSMIKINNLTKKFGRKSILTNFNLNIENGLEKPNERND